MKKTHFTVPILKAVAGLLVLVIIVVWMSGGFRDKISPDAESDIPARAIWQGPTADVEAESQTVIEQVVGSIQAAKRTTVSSKILAQVLKVHVNAGDIVKEGQTIIELDARDLKARVEQAQQQTESAKATLDRAQSDFQRAENLLKTGNISQSQMDSARAERDVALAAWEQAKRAVDEAQVALTYAKISAPVSGRVVERLVEPGDTVAPGQNVLSIYDPQTMRLEVPVRESVLSALDREKIGVSIDALQVELNGQVDEIVPQAETGSRTFLVKVTLPKQEGLYPGMFGRLTIPVGSREQIFVPMNSIESVGQLDFVQVVDAENRLHRRFVTLGRKTTDNRIEVLSGLKAGEKIALKADRQSV